MRWDDVGCGAEEMRSMNQDINHDDVGVLYE
jgi:hypothetical protein